MMKIPSKEVLQFLDEVYPWAEKVDFVSGYTVITFKRETPQKVLNLFDKLTKRPDLNFYKRV